MNAITEISIVNKKYLKLKQIMYFFKDLQNGTNQKTADFRLEQLLYSVHINK